MPVRAQPRREWAVIERAGAGALIQELVFGLVLDFDLGNLLGLEPEFVLEPGWLLVPTAL